MSSCVCVVCVFVCVFSVLSSNLFYQGTVPGVGLLSKKTWHKTWQSTFYSASNSATRHQTRHRHFITRHKTQHRHLTRHFFALRAKFRDITGNWQNPGSSWHCVGKMKNMWCWGLRKIFTKWFTKYLILILWCSFSSHFSFFYHLNNMLSRW